MKAGCWIFPTTHSGLNAKKSSKISCERKYLWEFRKIINTCETLEFSNWERWGRKFKKQTKTNQPTTKKNPNQAKKTQNNRPGNPCTFADSLPSVLSHRTHCYYTIYFLHNDSTQNFSLKSVRPTYSMPVPHNIYSC